MRSSSRGSAPHHADERAMLIHATRQQDIVPRHQPRSSGLQWATGASGHNAITAATLYPLTANMTLPVQVIARSARLQITTPRLLISRRLSRRGEDRCVDIHYMQEITLTMQSMEVAPSGRLHARRRYISSNRQERRGAWANRLFSLTLHISSISY